MKMENPKNLHVIVEGKVKKEYQKYCLDKEINMSDRVRELIIKDLKGEIK